MATKTWNNSLADQNWDAAANWTAGLPSNGDDIVIPDCSIVDPPLVGPTVAITAKSLTFTHGRLGSFDYESLSLSNSGGTALTMWAVQYINLANIIGKINETSATGTNLQLFQLDGSANYSGSVFMHVSSGSGTMKYNADAAERTNQQIDLPFTGTIVTDTNTVSLGDNELSAGVTLQVLNGGSFSNFVQDRASGQQAKYATVTGGVEQSHETGSTISGTYDGRFGFVPDTLFALGVGDGCTDFVASGGTTSSETWAAKLNAGGGPIPTGSQDLQLWDSNNIIQLWLDTITVTVTEAVSTDEPRPPGLTRSLTIPLTQAAI